jgi:hypothetical protein
MKKVEHLPLERCSKFGRCKGMIGKDLFNSCPVCCRQGEVLICRIETENIAMR